MKTIITLRSGRQDNQPMPKPKEKKKKKKEWEEKENVEEQENEKVANKDDKSKEDGIISEEIKKKDKLFHLFQKPFNQARW